MKHEIYCVNCGELIANVNVTTDKREMKLECLKCRTAFYLKTDSDDFGNEVVIDLINPSEPLGNDDLPRLSCPFCGKGKNLVPVKLIKEDIKNVLQCGNSECKRMFTVERS